MMGWMLWILIVALGLVTYGLRVAFFLRPSNREAPTAQREGSPSPAFLRLLPAAVLAALIVPALAVGGPGSALPVTQWLAGLVGLVVAIWSAKHPAWRRYAVLLTLGSGLVALWLLHLVGM